MSVVAEVCVQLWCISVQAPAMVMSLTGEVDVKDFSKVDYMKHNVSNFCIRPRAVPGVLLRGASVIIKSKKIEQQRTHQRKN